MIDLNKVDKIFKVNFPIVDSTLVKFNFSAGTDDGDFIFHLWYFNSIWNCWVTLPNGEKRFLCFCKNILHWSKYLDYSAYVNFDTEITQSNITDANIYLIKWL